MIEMILVKGFCPLKIKITQFPNGFRLKLNLQIQFSCLPWVILTQL